MRNLEKFRQELINRIEHLETMVKEYPKSFYYDGCLTEAKYQRDVFFLYAPKESEVEHA